MNLARRGRKNVGAFHDPRINGGSCRNAGTGVDWMLIDGFLRIDLKFTQ